jgi:hypothetical protein
LENRLSILPETRSETDDDVYVLPDDLSVLVRTAGVGDLDHCKNVHNSSAKSSILVQE